MYFSLKMLKGLSFLALGVLLCSFSRRVYGFGGWNLLSNSSLAWLEVIYTFFLVCLNAPASLTYFIHSMT